MFFLLNLHFCLKQEFFPQTVRKLCRSDVYPEFNTMSSKWNESMHRHYEAEVETLVGDELGHNEDDLAFRSERDVEDHRHYDEEEGPESECNVPRESLDTDPVREKAKDGKTDLSEEKDQEKDITSEIESVGAHEMPTRKKSGKNKPLKEDGKRCGLVVDKDLLPDEKRDSGYGSDKENKEQENRSMYIGSTIQWTHEDENNYLFRQNMIADVQDETFMDLMNSKQDGSETAIALQEKKAFVQRLVCKLCLETPAEILFLPCGDLLSCWKCAQTLDVCIQCSSKVFERKVVRFSTEKVAVSGTRSLQDVQTFVK